MKCRRHASRFAMPICPDPALVALRSPQNEKFRFRSAASSSLAERSPAECCMVSLPQQPPFPARRSILCDILHTVTSIFYFECLFANDMLYPLEPLPKWFRAAALANPITCQINCLRWGTIGLGSSHRVAVEAIGFLVFGLVSFASAVRCLQRQEWPSAVLSAILISKRSFPGSIRWRFHHRIVFVIRTS